MQENPFQLITVSLIILLLLAGLIFGALVQLTQPVPVSAREPFEPIQSVDQLIPEINAILEKTNTPAAAAATVSRDGTVWTYVTGFADVENQRPADEDTLFRLGSTSKIFVGLAVLKLVEEGQLSLDDNLADLAPDVTFVNAWEETHPIKLVHLLEHTTGWDDWRPRQVAHAHGFINTPIPLKTGIDFHDADRESRWQPGTRFSYANSGYGVAAYVVETVTGERFEDYVEREFFRPIGMPNTSYFYEDGFAQHGVVGYIDGETRPYWHVLQRPAGSINSTIGDMAKLAQFFVADGVVDGQQIISADSLRRMETPQSLPTAAVGMLGYGLANASYARHGFLYQGHHGSVDGARGQLLYSPTIGTAHVVMINAESEARRQISELLVRYEARNADGAGQQPSTTNQSGAGDLAGTYINIAPRDKMFSFLERVADIYTIAPQADGLTLSNRMNGTTDLLIGGAAPSTFNDPDSGRVALTVVEDPLEGETVHYLGSIAPNTLKKVSLIRAFFPPTVLVLWGVVSLFSLLSGVVWLGGMVFGRFDFSAARLIIFLSTVAGLGFALLLAFNLDRYAVDHVNVVTVGIMLCTLLFALLSVAALVVLPFAKTASMGRFSAVSSILITAVNLLFTAYLLYYGWVGIRMWAY